MGDRRPATTTAQPPVSQVAESQQPPQQPPQQQQQPVFAQGQQLAAHAPSGTSTQQAAGSAGSGVEGVVPGPPVGPRLTERDLRFDVEGLCTGMATQYKRMRDHYMQLVEEHEMLRKSSAELYRVYLKIYEMASMLNVEVHKQSKIKAQVNEVLINTIKLLPPAAQPQVQAELARAQTVSQAYLLEALRTQAQVPKMDPKVYPQRQFMSQQQPTQQDAGTNGNGAIRHDGKRQRVAAPMPTQVKKRKDNAMEDADDDEREFVSVTKKVSNLRICENLSLVSTSTLARCTEETFRLFTGSKGVVTLWDKQGPPITSVPCCDGEVLRCCQCSSDKARLYVGGEANHLEIFDCQLDALQNVGKLVAEPKFMSICPSRTNPLLLYTCHSTGKMYSWDVRLDKPINVVLAHESFVTCASTVGTHNLVTGGGKNNLVRLWDTRNMSAHMKDVAMESAVFSLASPPSGKFIVVGKHSGVTVLNDDLTVLNDEFGLTSAVHNVAAANQDDWFLATSNSGITAFDITANSSKFAIEQTELLCCDISPDDSYIMGGAKRCAYVYQY